MPAVAEIGTFLPSQPLDNPRHERFAQLVSAAKMSDTEAYQIAYGCAYDQANSNAWRVKVEEGVRARIQYLQGLTAQQITLTSIERRAYLARVVRADPRKLGEADGDLIQEITHDPETGAVVKLKLPGKRECIETDAKLAGEWDGPQEHSSPSVVIEQAVMLIFGDRARQWVEQTKQASIVDAEALTDTDVASTEGPKESVNASFSTSDT